MSDVEAVLLDLDDTICVYRQSVAEVLTVAFESAGVEPFFDAAEYRDRFGEFADAGEDVREIRRAAFATFAREAGRDPGVGRAVADAYADERDQADVEFTPGAERALDALADRYRLGLVTDGDPWMQSRKLEGLDIADRFETVVHGGHDAPLKPDPEPFEVALADLDAPPERAVMVGNSLTSDVAGAHNAEIASVWLSDGRSDPDPEPDHVIDSMADLTAEPWR